MAKYLDLDGLTYLWGKITSKFVAKETGKGLSSNDYTTAEKTKLANIAAGAEVNVQSDWSVTSTSSDAYIKNKPTIPDSTSDLTNDSGFITSSDLGDFYTKTETDDLLDAKADVTALWPMNANINSHTLSIDRLYDDLHDIFPEHTRTGQDATSFTGANYIRLGGENIYGANIAQLTDLNSALSTKQNTLVSGTNIKTVNGTSLLGSGDVTIGAGSSDYTDLSNKPSVNSVTLSGNKTASDLGLQNAIEVITKTASDTTNTLEEDKFYVFPTMSSLTVTVSSTGMYAFRFTSGSTATTLTVTGATMPDSFTVESGKVYEVNIYQGYGVVSSWTA